MSSIAVSSIKRLREKTDAPVLLCKEALVAAEGDMGKAMAILRERGIQLSSNAIKYSGNGHVCLYTHGFGKIGVMVEIRCETDLTAKLPEFIRVGNTIAMHIAWANPKWLDIQDVPWGDIEQHMRESLNQGSEGYVDSAGMVAARLKEFYAANCLMEQSERKENGGAKTVRQVIVGLSEELGEKVWIARFDRYEIGG